MLWSMMQMVNDADLITDSNIQLSQCDFDQVTKTKNGKSETRI